MSSDGLSVRGPRAKQVLVVVINTIFGTLVGWACGLFLDNFGLIAAVGLVGLLAILLVIVYTKNVDLLAIGAIAFLATSLIAATVSYVSFRGPNDSHTPNPSLSITSAAPAL